MNLHFQYDFRPVGQGLFSTGRLIRDPRSSAERSFRWVYDCGAELRNHRADLDREVAIYEPQCDGPLDLVVFSHFDEDHISGLARLLTHCHADRIVLPYLSARERLLILAQTEDASDSTVRFVIEPVAALRALPGGAEAQIIFVRAGNGPAPAVERLPDFNPWDREAGEFFKPPGKAGGNLVPDEPSDAELYSSPDVLVITDDVTFQALGLWEFVFFNRARTNESAELEELWGLVKPSFEALRATPPARRDYGAFITELKGHYDKVFGRSGYARNNISLWCYTGPLSPRLSQTSYSPWLSTYVATSPHHAAARPTVDRFYRMSIRALGKVSLLYTGDITLGGRLLASARQHFQPERWRRVEFFQVPHHGAKTSWLVADAPSLTHSFSVFSSAYRGRLEHPAPEVVEHLASRGPTFVHEFSGAHWGGTASWR